jgi:hypothetical protein
VTEGSTPSGASPTPPTPQPNPKRHTPVMLIDGTWYQVTNVETCSDLAEDVRKHMQENEAWVYDLAPVPPDTREPARQDPAERSAEPSGEATIEPVHVVVDGSGRMVPLGVMTHGGINPPS